MKACRFACFPDGITRSSSTADPGFLEIMRHSVFELIAIYDQLPANKCGSRFCERVPRPTTGSFEGVNAIFCADWKDTFSPTLVMRERTLFAKLPLQQRIYLKTNSMLFLRCDIRICLFLCFFDEII